MIKAYKYLLGNIAIIDTTSKTISIMDEYDIVHDRQARKTNQITKATVNKHLKDDGFVASAYILSSFAPDKDDIDYYTKKAEKYFIGSFDNYNTFADYVKALHSQTEEIKKTYHFVNFGSSFWDVVVALRQGKTEQEYNQHNNKHISSLMLFKALERREM